MEKEIEALKTEAPNIWESEYPKQKTALETAVRPFLHAHRGTDHLSESKRDLVDNSPKKQYTKRVKLTPLHRNYLDNLLANGKSPATVQAYASDFQILLAFLGADDVRALTREKALEFPTWLSKRLVPQRRGATGHSPRGIQRRVASASSFCRWLRKRGDIQENPFDDVERPKKPRLLPRSLNPDTVVQMLNLPILSTMERAILATMRFAGLRVGEVGHVQREDVRQGTNGAIRVIGKGNKERVVPILDDLVPYLDAWISERGDHAGSLFTSKQGHPISRKCVERLLRLIEVEMKIPHFTSHQFRHTCGVQLILMGVPANFVQEMFGHESLETTSLYTRVSGRQLFMVNRIVSQFKQVQDSVTPPKNTKRKGVAKQPV